jgi:hypothetical protein
MTRATPPRYPKFSSLRKRALDWRPHQEPSRHEPAQHVRLNIISTLSYLIPLMLVSSTLGVSVAHSTTLRHSRSQAPPLQAYRQGRKAFSGTCIHPSPTGAPDLLLLQGLCIGRSQSIRCSRPRLCLHASSRRIADGCSVDRRTEGHYLLDWTRHPTPPRDVRRQQSGRGRHCFYFYFR